MRFLGIDPGASGGVALLDDSGAILHAQAMPQTPTDVADAIRAWAIGDAGTETYATLERVQAWAGSPMGKAACFAFGRGYGHLEMALLMLELPHQIIPPQKWQAYLNCLTHGDKAVTKACAQRLWPRHKITHAIADALLIAEYGRRTHQGPHGEKESRKEQVEASSARRRRTEHP